MVTAISDSSSSIDGDASTRHMHNPAGRLGCGWGGPSEVAFHDFFTGINFKELEARQLPMPYVPVIKNAFDTSNFDNYSDDDGAAQWVQFNASQYEPIWKSEFDSDDQ